MSKVTSSSSTFFSSVEAAGLAALALGFFSPFAGGSPQTSSFFLSIACLT